MAIKQRTVLQKAEQLATLYNLALSLFWTLLNLVPAACYFYLHLPTTWLWIIVPLSLLPYLLPVNLLNRLSASNSRRWYQQIGVRVILKYAQQGGFINRRIRTHYPDYRIVYDKKTVLRKIHETYMFERFHLGLLLVFFIIAGHALKNAYWQWAILLLSNNFLYNIYPILLQQYLRLRLKRLLP